jgi:NAD(P)-dependent dehydrogenase (short-subunit alcohol dehydrogenase family)
MTTRTAIVTGASRGIGRQIAIALGGAGFNVVVAARSVTPHGRLAGSIGETVRAVEAAGGRAIAVATDIRAAASIEALVAAAIEAFGGIDVLVNNAADTSGGTPKLTDMEVPDWLGQFDTNLHGPLRLMQAVVPHLRQRGGGVIVNMTSGAADLVDGISGEASVLGGERLAYAASKAALNRLANALAPELAADNIVVVNVDPGFTRTELVDLMAAKGVVDASAAVPMSTPTAAVLHLATSADAARYAGSIIRADEFVRELGLQ